MFFGWPGNFDNRSLLDVVLRKGCDKRIRMECG